MADLPQIPQSFIRTLNEHTTGGYLICYFDLDGNPRIQCEFDNTAYALAAQRHVGQWIEAVATSQKNSMVQMLDAMNSPASGDSDDGEPA